MHPKFRERQYQALEDILKARTVDMHGKRITARTKWLLKHRMNRILRSWLTDTHVEVSQGPEKDQINVDVRIRNRISVPSIDVTLKNPHTEDTEP